MTLDELAIKHKTDKSSLHHGYASIYEKHFQHLKNEPILFIECGIGGYEHPERGGQSLRMWREWFTKAIIVGIDINVKTFKIPNVEFVFMSQTDYNLPNLFKDVDIFIDDASHINPLTLNTFSLMFKSIKPGGFYVIEDIETSWCDTWAKGCSDASNFSALTAVNLGRLLINDLNYRYSQTPNPYPVKAIHFYENLIIIQKK